MADQPKLKATTKAEALDSESRPDSSFPATARWIIDFEPMRYESAYYALIALATFDIVLTWLIIFELDWGSEINPLANVVIRDHALWGMIMYKFALTVFFIVLCEEIGRRAANLGRRMARLGIAISSIPILWVAFSMLGSILVSAVIPG